MPNGRYHLKIRRLRWYLTNGIAASLSPWPWHWQLSYDGRWAFSIEHYHSPLFGLAWTLLIGPLRLSNLKLTRRNLFDEQR